MLGEMAALCASRAHKRIPLVIRFQYRQRREVLETVEVGFYLGRLANNDEVRAFVSLCDLNIDGMLDCGDFEPCRSVLSVPSESVVVAQVRSAQCVCVSVGGCPRFSWAEGFD